MVRPKLLIGIETLLSGGAESFVLRLANSLSSIYDVSLFVVFGDRIDERLLLRQKNHFRLFKFKLPLDFIVMKLDGLLLRLKIDYSLRNFFVIKRLKKLIGNGKYDILHSNQFKVDLVFYLANLNFKIPHFTTIHGDYITFSRQSSEGQLRILNYNSKARRVLLDIDGIVYISDQQRNFLKSEFGLIDLDSRITKIYNGIILPADVSLSPKVNKKKQFVFGMVARGIPEKGWETAIKAFMKLCAQDCHLTLVGESEYLKELERKYKNSNVTFAGYTSDPLKSINDFDVGLLPSTFTSESLPTSVIEYLAMGKPVIATDIGEIRGMLNQNGRISGFLLPLHEGEVDLTLFANSMLELKVNRELYLSYSTNARNNAKAFDINLCSSLYSELYLSKLSKER